MDHEAKVKAIIEEIKASEPALSDGFGYYASDVDYVLTKLAEAILKRIEP